MNIQHFVLHGENASYFEQQTLKKPLIFPFPLKTKTLLDQNFSYFSSLPIFDSVVCVNHFGTCIHYFLYTNKIAQQID